MASSVSGSRAKPAEKCTRRSVDPKGRGPHISAPGNTLNATCRKESNPQASVFYRSSLTAKREPRYKLPSSMPTALVSEHLTGVVNSRGNEDEGWLELIIGPMFSGKTTELMQRVRRHRAAGRLCLVVKSAKDTRYTGAQDVLSTHDRMELPALSAERLRDVANVEFMYRVIAVDEGQFFPGERSSWPGDAPRLVVGGRAVGMKPTTGRQPLCPQQHSNEQ